MERERGMLGGRGAEEAARALRGERLSRVLDEVQGLCAELDVLSRRQGAELDSGRAEEAAQVVEARGRVVGQLAACAAELGADAAGFERVLEGVPAGLAARAREQAARISALVGEVLERDREDRVLLERERDRVAGQLAEVGKGRSAIGAYGGGVQTDPMLQDRRG